MRYRLLNGQYHAGGASFYMPPDGVRVEAVPGGFRTVNGPGPDGQTWPCTGWSGWRPIVVVESNQDLAARFPNQFVAEG